MAVRHDIAINSNNLVVSQGDFAIAASDMQHIQDTINAAPGWWKEFPLDGVDVVRFSKASSDLQFLARKIKTELQADGYKVDNPIISLSPAGKLTINPNATRL